MRAWVESTSSEFEDIDRMNRVYSLLYKKNGYWHSSDGQTDSLWRQECFDVEPKAPQELNEKTRNKWRQSMGETSGFIPPKHYKHKEQPAHVHVAQTKVETDVELDFFCPTTIARAAKLTRN